MLKNQSNLYQITDIQLIWKNKQIFSKKIKRGEKMPTRLEKFKKEMEPAKEIYTKEIKSFAKKYDFLGDMTLKEEPDIDTQDYIFCFEKLNGTSEDVLDQTLGELYGHMKTFSKTKGINEFSKNTIIIYREG